VNHPVAISFALAALATGCGSDRDLVIGRNEIAVVAVPDGANMVALDAATSDALSEGDDASTADGAIEATPCPPDEVPPAGSLLHRYSFDGTGTMVRDTVGTADGTALAGATLDGSGTLTLDGDNDYVNLPNGLISSLDEVTIAAWITAQQRDVAVFERIFDFGSSTGAEDQQAKGKSFVMVTPFSDTGDGHDLTMQAGTPALGVIQIASDRSIRDGSFHQVALVFRSGTGVALYLDGDLIGTRATRMKLSDIEDVNDWLGQSQFLQDKYNFAGTYTEFRIYGSALSFCALRQTVLKGPDLLP
jgi:hypothetical protein